MTSIFLILMLFNRFVKNNHQNTDIACISYKCIYSPTVLKCREKNNILQSFCSFAPNAFYSSSFYHFYVSLFSPLAGFPACSSFLMLISFCKTCLPLHDRTSLRFWREFCPTSPHFLHMLPKAQPSMLAVTGDITTLSFQ